MQRLYHFTGAQYGVAALVFHRLKIARLSQLNDPFEFIGLDRSTPFAHDLLTQLRANFDRELGVVCFSHKYSNPLLWGHYADKLSGMALGFDVDDEDIHEVIYAEKPPEVNVVQAADGTPEIPDSFGRALARTKFVDWKYEEEARVFAKLRSKNEEGGLYFLPFSERLVLRELVLGPRSLLPLQHLERLVDAMHHGVSIVQTRISANMFEISKAA